MILLSLVELNEFGWMVLGHLRSLGKSILTFYFKCLICCYVLLAEQKGLFVGLLGHIRFKVCQENKPVIGDALNGSLAFFWFLGKSRYFTRAADAFGCRKSFLSGFWVILDFVICRENKSITGDALAVHFVSLDSRGVSDVSLKPLLLFSTYLVWFTPIWPYIGYNYTVWFVGCSWFA